jgi:hypothetical protein
MELSLRVSGGKIYTIQPSTVPPSSDLTTLMGRGACHTGKAVTWDQIMNSNFMFCPDVDKLTYDSPAPLLADENGQFEVPVPGKWKEI